MTRGDGGQAFHMIGIICPQTFPVPNHLTEGRPAVQRGEGKNTKGSLSQCSLVKYQQGGILKEKKLNKLVLK